MILAEIDWPPIVAEFLGALIGAIATIFPFLVAVLLYEPYKKQRDAFESFETLLNSLVVEISVRRSAGKALMSALDAARKSSVWLGRNLDAAHMRALRSLLVPHRSASHLVQALSHWIEIATSFEVELALRRSEVGSTPVLNSVTRINDRNTLVDGLQSFVQASELELERLLTETKNQIQLLPSRKPNFWTSWKHAF
jgi:hypothetical protein